MNPRLLCPRDSGQTGDVLIGESSLAALRTCGVVEVPGRDEALGTCCRLGVAG